MSDVRQGLGLLGGLALGAVLGAAVMAWAVLTPGAPEPPHEVLVLGGPSEGAGPPDPVPAPKEGGWSPECEAEHTRIGRAADLLDQLDQAQGDKGKSREIIRQLAMIAADEGERGAAAACGLDLAPVAATVGLVNSVLADPLAAAALTLEERSLFVRVSSAFPP